MAVLLLTLLPACSSGGGGDLYINNALIYDGSGDDPVRGAIHVQGDRIVSIDSAAPKEAKNVIDAGGLAVAPGFINMLSWAVDSLIVDGRSESDIRQGVTLEIFGEGESMGPLNAKMKKDAQEGQGDIKYPVNWTTLGEYLRMLEKKGVACNVGSFVGATTLRIHEIGYEDRPPTAVELQRMCELTRQAMQEGALGIGSSLIYAPAFYSTTDELIAICKVAAEYDGLYISHLRSEGNRFMEALEELITISRQAGIRAEVYHFKAAGQANWGKMDQAIARIQKARAEGLKITADMYLYTAGATGLDAAMPPWVQEGGYNAWAARLKDPATRAKVKTEMTTPTTKWESLYLAAGSPERVLLVGFKNDKLKPLTGKSLAEVAKMRGKSPEETAMDLVVEDGSRVDTIYFMMSEDNVKKQIALPWVSFGSDAPSLSPEGVFLKSNQHPRAYGNVARLLGKYVRDEKVIPLAEAIRKLTSLPAENLRLKDRGWIKSGYKADLVIFDPAKIRDRATFEKPHQLAEGVRDVIVNGQAVLRNGQFTGIKSGQVVRGPGWKAGH